jgi:myxalamid-type polyketide synthase MxaE and MxaD
VLDALERRAARTAHALPRIPLVSNLTGAVFAAGTGPDARYWRRHTREAVRFAACIDALRASGATALVEVGPHPTLIKLAAQAAPQAAWSAMASLRRGRDDRREMLSSLAALFVRGAAVRWDAVIANQGGHRRALPTYPFQRERYWVAAADVQAPAEASRAHPLLGERRMLAGGQRSYVWERDIGLQSHPWLQDHRVQGAAIVPATAYIEMALAAAHEVLGKGSISVREIRNLKPIILSEGLTHRLQASLVIDADGTGRFAVHGRRIVPDEDERQATWTAHVTALLAVLAEQSAEQNGIAALDAAKGRSDSELMGADFYALLARKGNQWGPCFQGLQHLWRSDGEALGRVEVVAPLAAEVSRYRFHPAVSDACGHTLVATAPVEASGGAFGGAFVGGGVGEIRFHRALAGQTVWAYARRRHRSDDDGNVISGDVWVYDDSGALLSETLDARLWYLDEAARSSMLGVPPDWYYEVCWRRQSLGSDHQAGFKQETWLIFADEAGVAEQIAALRRAAGRDTLLVSRGEAWSVRDGHITIRADDPEDYPRLLSSIGKPSVIVHLWNLDSARRVEDSHPIDDGVLSGTESMLHLLHGIRTLPSAWRPRVWLVTSDTQAVVRGDCCNALWGAPVWGLGKALSAEHAQLWGGLIDLPAEIDAQRHAQQLMHEIEAGSREDRIAYRDGERFVARLEHRLARNGERRFSVRADATYVLSGGLGGIGLAIARWLVERGARYLLLLGRTAAPERAQWDGLDPESPEGRRAAAISAIEAQGARVETQVVDVADGGAVRRCLNGYENAGWPQIRGVIHAAGVLQFEALETQSIDSLRLGLAAKVAGAWHLHRILSDRTLDCFVMCSSTSALLSSPLLGGYAAGNSFLDALAHHRRARGLSALSVNWGTWSEVGMALGSSRSPAGQMQIGMSALSTSQGLAALSELLECADTQAAVMPIDWALFSRGYPAFAAEPFFESLVASGHESNANVTAPTPAALREMQPESRVAAVQSYLHTAAARVLGLLPERLDVAMALSSFGLDSLMAAQLKNRVEADIGAVVPMIQFLQGPSIEQLVGKILEAAEAPESEPALAMSGGQQWEEGSV